MTTKMLDAALYYIGRGLPVFPLRKHLKTPATPDGFKSGTLDHEPAHRFFATNPALNIGIATGGGILVLDIDRKHGVDGGETVKALEQVHGNLPDTWTVGTPSGGEHRFYHYPAGAEIRSSAGKIAGKDAPGLDIRADGGYVVAAPSHTEASADPSGKTFTGTYATTSKAPIAALPDGWVRLLVVNKDAHKPAQAAAYAPSPQANYRRLAELQEALAAIDAKPYDDWIKVGMALYSLGDDGFHLWDTWSRNAPNYDAAEINKRWKTFASSSVNVETVFFMAQDVGWINPAKGRKPEQESHKPTQEQQQQYQHQQRRERSSGQQDTDCDHVRLVSGLSITPRRLEWVWKDWLPRGKLSLLVGAPKTGKTLLAIELAAVITSGGKFPDGTRADKSTVIFWTAEDDLDDTIVPRFKAAGGDLANVRFIDHTMSSGRGQPFNPAVDMPLLKDAISRMDKPPAMLILDPVVSVTPDMNNASMVRMSLAPVVELAQAHGMAVLGITHFRKSSAESGNLSERILGSQAFLAVARMVWFAIKPPDMDSQRVFFKGDTNLAESDEGFMYEVEGREAEFKEHQLTIQTAGVVWGEKLQGEALQAFIKPGDKVDSTPLQAEAEVFLTQYLANGARLKNEINEEADNRGITKITLGRAKRDLGVKHRKRRGDGKYEWYLKEDSNHVDHAHT